MDANLSPHILFADSDALLCVTARRALHERGFAVTIAHDGFEALERFDQRPFAAVVLGLSLRLVNGLRALREIKQRRPEIPVILLAAPQSDTHAPEHAEAFALVRTPLTDWNAFAATLSQALRASAPAAPDAPPPGASEATFAIPLQSLSEKLRAIKPLEETLDALLHATLQTMETTHAALTLIEGDHLRLYRNVSAAGDDVNVTFDEAWLQRVADERHTLSEPMTNDASAVIIATPLLARDMVFGTLVAYPLAPADATPARLRWFELLATQGGLALELERLTSEFVEQLPTDPVTGMLKRAPFLELADREFRRAWRYNQPLAAIVLGLDDLASLRATRGTFLADRVLKLSAQACRSTVRSVDLVCRYTDETFALLLLMATRADARRVTERLRDGITGLELSDGKGPLRLTTSLGVGAYPRDGCASVFDLLNVAQEAQHAARHDGANQIVYV